MDYHKVVILQPHKNLSVDKEPQGVDPAIAQVSGYNPEAEAVACFV